MIKQQKKLEPEQSERLFNILEQRFQQYTERHMQISWAFVREKLLQSPEKLYALQQMEMSRGEPDVVVLPNTQDVYFFDCSIESPKGRRSMCYDREALLSRKDHPPENTVLDWVQAYGLSLKFRSTLVTAMFSGYAMGGIMAALLGVAFTPTFGWKIMFFIAGIPLLFIPILWKFLPESVTFLVKDQQTEKARSIIQRLVPEETVTSDTVLVLNEAKVPDASVAALFKNGRGMGTVLFWCCFFMCLLMVYALGSWLPKLMMAAGYSMGSSLMFLLSLNIGAVIGTAGGGVLADRFHLKPVIISMLTVGAFALVGLGFNSPQPVIYLLVALAGAASIGCSILLYSYVAQYYPLAVRSTGLGWASGIGRVGAIVGPIVIGVLLGMELPHKLNFIAVAIPAVLAAIAVSFIRLNSAEEAVKTQVKVSSSIKASS